MSLRLKMIYGCLTGAWGGYLAWVLLDLVLGVPANNVYWYAFINGITVSTCIGVLISGFEGAMERNRTVLLRHIGNGLLAGFVGGMIGGLFGEWLFQQFAQTSLVRVVGWAIFGAVIGLGDGLLRGSWRRMLLGAVGGLVGGVLGSFAFLLVNATLSAPAFSRALGFTLLGALIGLCIGFVPVVIGSLLGTLKVVSSGRHEGKEILLDKNLISIGHNDGCDLALYGIPDVQPIHAEIRRNPQGYLIRKLGQASLLINGQAVEQHLLQSGERIRVGSAEILFRTNERA